MAVIWGNATYPRPGHKSSGGAQEGFEADAQIIASGETVQQGELVDENGAEGKALGRDQAGRGDRLVAIEDALELLIEVRAGEGAALVDDAAHVRTPVRVGPRTGAGPD